MDPAGVIAVLDWTAPPRTRSDPEAIRGALNMIAAGESEESVAWAVAALEDRVGNRHGAVLYPVAHLAATVMLAVVEHWRAQAREQALCSLHDMLSTEVLPGYETYTHDGVEVEVEVQLYQYVRDVVPMLQSVAAERPVWRNNRKLALELIDRALAGRC